MFALKNNRIQLVRVKKLMIVCGSFVKVVVIFYTVFKVYIVAVAQKNKYMYDLFD